jgi:AAA domain
MIEGFSSTREISIAHGAKTLIYGGSGVGKTRLLASAPRPLIASAEKGLLSLRGFDIPVREITSILGLNQFYQDIFRTSIGQQAYTICLDSSSEIAERCLEDAKAKNKDGRKAYGDVQDELIKQFRLFRDIPGKHVVFLAKQEYTVDGATGAKYWAPSFPGNKLAQAAPYFFDEVFELVTAKDAQQRPTWFLRTRPDNQHVAKDRSGVLNEWENADPATGGGLSAVFDKMMKG